MPPQKGRRAGEVRPEEEGDTQGSQGTEHQQHEVDFCFSVGSKMLSDWGKVPRSQGRRQDRGETAMDSQGRT